MLPGKNTTPSSSQPLEDRLVRYVDLQPCTTAFIDTRTPGSAAKENFTIIGPGVAENPEQHVHINIPHGFNIGGARQPPGCVNSQHSHETAEVFVVHSGRWAFYLGVDGQDASIVLNPGDTISIPVNVFRGFENVGDSIGFLFAILGGDDPGKVTWAPYVFDAAAEHGLVLLEDGSLVDTAKGESIPTNKRAMARTTDSDVSLRAKLSKEQLSACVVTKEDIGNATPGVSATSGLPEQPIIGADSANENISCGKLAWPHGFRLRHVTMAPGDSTEPHTQANEEVIFLHQGELRIECEGKEVILHPGDTFTTPIGVQRKFLNKGDIPLSAYIVRGGD